MAATTPDTLAKELAEALRESRKLAWPWVDKNTGLRPRLTFEEWCAVYDRQHLALARYDSATKEGKSP